MGAAANKKRKRRQGESGAETPPPAPPAEAAAPFVPARPVTLALLAVAIGGAGYFVSEGFASARGAEGRMAGTLLRVEARDQAPPPFELTDFDGKKVGLDDIEGKVVFINFWATWCPPCVKEMPSMIRLDAKLADDPRFEMVTISADEAWPEVRAFFDGAPPPFPVLLDPGGDLAKKFGTEKFPETYILVNGRIRAFIWGDRDWDDWYAEAYIRGLLEGS